VNPHGPMRRPEHEGQTLEVFLRRVLHALGHPQTTAARTAAEPKDTA
jgi:hypothetical protein